MHLDKSASSDKQMKQDKLPKVVSFDATSFLRVKSEVQVHVSESNETLLLNSGGIDFSLNGIKSQQSFFLFYFSRFPWFTVRTDENRFRLDLKQASPWLLGDIAFSFPELISSTLKIPHSIYITDIYISFFAMPLPPHRALGLAAEIIPSPPITPLGPTEDPPSQPADIPPTPNSATSFQTMIQSYTPEHRIYAKIQRLRCLPFESSPLTWPSRTWIWDGEVWNEQGIRSASESVEDVDMEPEVRSDVAGPSTTTTFSRPSTSFSGSRNVSMKIKIGPKSPRSSPNQVWVSLYPPSFNSGTQLIY